MVEGQVPFSWKSGFQASLLVLRAEESQKCAEGGELRSSGIGYN